MTTRTLLGLLLLVACEGGDKGAAQGGAGGAGSAAPTQPAPATGSSAPVGNGSGSSAPAGSGSSAPAASFCFERKGGFAMDHFTATDDTATLCGSANGKRRCATASLSTGAFTVAADGAIPQAPEPAPPLLATADGKYKLQVDAKRVRVIETGTGKRKQLRVGDKDFRCVEGARFLGNTVYATASLCDRPRSVGALYTPAGTPIGAPLEAVNLQEAQPFHLEGDRWAFHSSDSEGVLVVDVATGAQRTVDPMTSEQAGQCCAIVVKGELPPFALTPKGKLVSIQAMLAVIDPATGKAEKAWMLPVCKP